jgi:hypothetical protein
MTTKDIPIKDIRIDGGTQQRPVEDKVVARYAALMKDGFPFDPVEIITDGRSNFLWDGFHRLAAASKLGQQYIAANEANSTQRDAKKASFSANKKNAYPRPDGTVKKILEKMWNDAEWSKMSITETAKHVGCTRAYVSKRYAEFADDSPGGTRKRDKSEKKVLDATGKQVPEHLLNFFERANDFRRPIRELNNMLKEVRKAKEAGDRTYSYIKIENLQAQIGNVKRIFRFGMPYAVCRYCGGDEMNDECRACGGSGFVNEMTYRSTAKELK